MVPFVDTPHGDTPAQLEYEVGSSENQKNYQSMNIKQAKQDLIKRIENEGNRLLQREEVVHVPLEQSSDKKQLYFAIQLLDETYKDQ